MNKKIINQYLVLLAGVIITSFAIGVFFLPNKIVSGGVSGMSNILLHTLKIPYFVSYFGINALLLLLAGWFIGRGFVIRTVISAALMALFGELFSHIPPLTHDLALATIFGGSLYGIGIGLAFVSGSSTGGTDILSRLFQVLWPNMKIGRILMAVDAAVIIASLLAFGKINLTLWGIVALVLDTYFVDYVIHKLNISKLAFVVTENGIEIAKHLVSTSPRGVTIIDSIGAYTMNDNKVLMCAVKESEIDDFQKKILRFDQNAFIIYSESQQIVGNGFRLYR